MKKRESYLYEKCGINLERRMLDITTYEVVESDIPR
jgi:hypothetical protein